MARPHATDLSAIREMGVLPGGAVVSTSYKPGERWLSLTTWLHLARAGLWLALGVGEVYLFILNRALNLNPNPCRCTA